MLHFRRLAVGIIRVSLVVGLRRIIAESSVHWRHEKEFEDWGCCQGLGCFLYAFNRLSARHVIAELSWFAKDDSFNFKVQ